jgi:hypothetical protein
VGRASPSRSSQTATIGGTAREDFFVSFDFTSDALQEIESFFKRSHKVIVALTVQEILDEHIAKKLV